MVFSCRRNSYSLAAALAAAIFAIASGGMAHANISISTAPTSNMSCSAGVCTATAINATLNASDLQSMLASGSTAIRTGTLAASIYVNAPFTWISANMLTLDAKRSVIVNKAVTDNGAGGLTIVLNDGGKGGVFSFGGVGSISFLGTSNAITINGASYTLVSSIASLASAIAANSSGNFALSRSYNATPDGTYATSPIPTAYSGNLQGFGNTISHLKISDATEYDNVGLFSDLQAGGSIGNLKMTAVSIGSGAHKALGGLVAVNGGLLFDVSVTGTVRAGSAANAGEVAGTNNGTIISSHAAGSLLDTATTSGGLLGGLAGYNTGSIESSDSSADVTSVYGYGGGFVGYMTGGTVTSSSATGVVSANVGGGLIGYLSSGSVTGSHAGGNVTASEGGGFAGGLDTGAQITNCYSTGNVTSTFTGGAAVGGFVGSNRGTISGSFAAGTVINETTELGSSAGGFVGYEDKDGIIENSYATGSASGAYYVGGFVGKTTNLPNSSDTISDSYSTGSATSGTSDGGFVGFNQYPAGQDYANAYWDTTTSGTALGIGSGNAAPITGQTTAQLQSGLPAGFSSSIWGENGSINGGLPYLLANPPP